MGSSTGGPGDLPSPPFLKIILSTSKINGDVRTYLPPARFWRYMLAKLYPLEDPLIEHNFIIASLSRALSLKKN